LNQRLNAPFVGDANDHLYQWDSSRDYNPLDQIDKIKATLLAINSADDERNPPELGVMQKALAKIPNARLLLIPASDQTAGHGTAGQAKWWKQEVGALIQSAPYLNSAPTGSNVAQGKMSYPGPQRAADIINERQANQDKRIAAGKAAGQISPQEEAQLRQMVEFINNAERQANKGNQAPRQMGGIKAPGTGNIDPAEFDKIMGMLDQLSNKIQISRETEAAALRMPNAPIQPVGR